MSEWRNEGSNVITQLNFPFVSAPLIPKTKNNFISPIGCIQLIFIFFIRSLPKISPLAAYKIVSFHCHSFHNFTALFVPKF